MHADLVGHLLECGTATPEEAQAVAAAMVRLGRTPPERLAAWRRARLDRLGLYPRWDGAFLPSRGP